MKLGGRKSVRFNVKPHDVVERIPSQDSRDTPGEISEFEVSGQNAVQVSGREPREVDQLDSSPSSDNGGEDQGEVVASLLQHHLRLWSVLRYSLIHTMAKVSHVC